MRKILGFLIISVCVLNLCMTGRAQAEFMDHDAGHSHMDHHHVMGEKDISMEDVPADISQKQKPQWPKDMDVKEIKVEAYQFGYSPERITVKKGQAVRLLVTSRDVTHGVYIKAYGINEKIEKGKITKIEFPADKKGEFDIICSVYCGSGHANMRATLAVE